MQVQLEDGGKNEDGVNITQQRMQSRVLAWLHSAAALLCGHYSRAGLILLSGAHTLSVGSIQGREEIEEIQ